MMPMGQKITNLIGIDFAFSQGCLLTAILATWTLSSQILPTYVPDQSQSFYLIFGLLGTVLGFVSIVIHELVHVAASKAFGSDISRMTLFLFGGVAEPKGKPHSLLAECSIAIAGPIASIIVAGFFWLMGPFAEWFGASAVTFEITRILAILNFALAVFNLLPAYPLDGGRILRAMLWWWHGDLQAATRFTAVAGVFLAYVIMGIGCLLLFQNQLVFGAWLILIGHFVSVVAESVLDAMTLNKRFGQSKVADLMSTDLQAASPELTLSELVNRVLLPHRISFAPVMDRGFLIGYIDAGIVSGIDRENWSNTRVADVYVEADESAIVTEDMAAMDLLRRVKETGRRKFLVAKANNLSGVITLADVARYIAILSDLNRKSV